MFRVSGFVLRIYVEEFMSKLNLQITYPTFIENLFVFFLLRYRKKKFGYEFRLFRLAKGRYAKVDPADFQRLSRYDWHLLETGGKTYVAMFNEGVILSMHRFIMAAPKGTIVDHKDRDGLNNTRGNLRFATHSQNCCNRRMTKRGASKYRGVSITKTPGKWQALIYFNGKRIYLGLFTDEEAAARAYDKAAKELHKDFAVLNFPQQSPSDSAGSTIPSPER